MRLLRDKKIYTYFFLLLFLGSINNKDLINNQFFKIKNLNINGASLNEQSKLMTKLNVIKNENIFFLSKKKITNILNSNNLVETFLVKKSYPSDLNIKIKKTSFLANINLDGKNFIIGSNKKLIESQFDNQNLPVVLGEPSISDFFKLKDDIQKSSLNYYDIKKFNFFKSKRWDLELVNGVLIKLPINNNIETLNNFIEIAKLSKFNNVKTFDMRIKNQVIVDGQ